MSRSAGLQVPTRTVVVERALCRHEVVVRFFVVHAADVCRGGCVSARCALQGVQGVVWVRQDSPGQEVCETAMRGGCVGRGVVVWDLGYDMQTVPAATA